MGLETARKALVRALMDGDFQHEARDTISEKNLLAIGVVTEVEVVLMLRRTRGDQYSQSPHDWDRDTVVHVFRPEIAGERWYVKAYFLEQPHGTAVFVSVHK